MSDPISEKSAEDCLLVIDDQESNIQVLGSMLGKLGFEILPATNGEQAFRRLAVRRPDLILLDVILPGMDGFEICRRIQEHEQWRDIPIIFLSAADDKNLIVRALESGGVDYITKPFNRLELVSRVRTHLMLKTSRDHLKRLAQDKEELLAMISHHMQNHLAAMQMSAQLLQDRVQGQDDAKLRLMTGNIFEASCQMISFVRSFLANAAADHQLTIEVKKVSLADAVTCIVRKYEEMAQLKQITLRAELPADGAVVYADPAALDQVLDNLVSNAIKFSPPGKEVRISVQLDRERVECRVQDQGAGLTAEDKRRLFQRYARLSAKPTGGEPSTGLGLSIARKLAVAMNGDLACESTPGQGATFILRLAAVTPKPEN